MGYHAGVCQSGYSFYALMYSDDIQPMREFLTENPSTLVVMSSDTYVQLYEDSTSRRLPTEMSITKRIAARLSTVHYNQVDLEREIQFNIWKRNVGFALTEDFERAASFGDLIVLAQR